MIENKLEGNEEADCERWECKLDRDGYTNMVRAPQLFLSNRADRIDLQNKNNDVRVKIFESQSSASQLLSANMRIIAWGAIVIYLQAWSMLLLHTFAAAQKVTYTFPEFPYKETNKNEVMFREVEAACERGCLGKHGVSKVLCIRQCVSPSCYRDLYQSDLLEEGEVDVRLNSFKGCFIQRYNKSRP